MDVDALFRDRFYKFMAEVIRYSQYIANGGILFVVVFISGFLAFYYKSMIAAIPSWFPVSYVLAFVLAIFVTRCPHRTFLLEADLLFLTPLETKLDRYFANTKRYNFIVQSIGLILILFVLLPLYRGTLKVEPWQLWLYWCIPVVLKGWNVYSSWILLRLPDRNAQMKYALARWLHSFVILAWVMQKSLPAYPFLWIVGSIVVAVPFFWFHVQLQKIKQLHYLPWYRLLEMEKRLSSTFYRIVNNFKDVPALQNRVNTWQALSVFTRLLPYRPKNAERLLFLKIFVRANGYGAMYTRLVLVGSLLIWSLPSIYVKAAVAALFLLMSWMQISAIWGSQRKRLLDAIIPLQEQKAKAAFKWGCQALLLIQAVIHGAVGLM